ncbi:MAG TPA: hypothetical protein VHA11_15500 [Bryobacteraceae bacterium]|nr:hypothetical protein [Bryobacteraceae bacterium]
MAMHAVAGGSRESLALYRRLRDECRQLSPEEQFGPGRVLVSAGFRPHASGEDLARIPASGPVLAVADGVPCAIESLAAADLLGRARTGVKVLAGNFLSKAPGVCAWFVPYERRESRDRARGNLRAAFAALAHLRSGGLLAAFPSDARQRFASAGEEPGWAAAVRLARLAGAAIVPVSLACMQAPDFPGGMPCSLEMQVGAPLDPARLAAFASDGEAGSYVRWRTTLLVRQRETPVRLVPRIFPLTKVAGL